MASTEQELRAPAGAVLTETAPVRATIASVTRPDRPYRVPAERYTSPEWAAREHAALWPRVWQVACTLDHVAEPGDCVINQDVDALQRVQRGLHQPGFTHLTLSGEECRIVNLHRNLERYLGTS